MTTNINEVANALVEARATGSTACVAEFSTHLTTTNDAYQVQDLVAQTLGWHAAGEAAHWKSGGGTRSGLLTHAALPPLGIWASPATAGNWPLRQRGVEAEIALRLGCDVTPAMALAAHHHTAQAWVQSLTVAIEVIHTHWDQGFQSPLLLKLADLQAHAALVLAGWQPWRDIDWAKQQLVITVNGDTKEQRQGSHPLQHPTWGLAEFARHVTRHGHTMPAGTVVTTGSWNGAYLATVGDLVEVQFEGIGSASVQF